MDCNLIWLFDNKHILELNHSFIVMHSLLSAFLWFNLMRAKTWTFHLFCPRYITKSRRAVSLCLKFVINPLIMSQIWQWQQVESFGRKLYQGGIFTKQVRRSVKNSNGGNSRSDDCRDEYSVRHEPCLPASVHTVWLRQWRPCCTDLSKLHHGSFWILSHPGLWRGFVAQNGFVWIWGSGEVLKRAYNMQWVSPQNETTHLFADNQKHNMFLPFIICPPHNFESF